MCYIFTQTFTSSSLHNIYYPLLLHTSVTGYGQMQEATNFTDVGAVNNKYFEKSFKWQFACNGRMHRGCVTLNLQTKFFSLQGDDRIFILFRKADTGNYTESSAACPRLSAFRRERWARATLFAVGRPDRYYELNTRSEIGDRFTVKLIKLKLQDFPRALEGALNKHLLSYLISILFSKKRPQKLNNLQAP